MLVELLAVGGLAYVMLTGRVGEGRNAARLAGRYLGRAAGTAVKVRAEAARVSAQQSAAHPDVMASSEAIMQSLAQLRAVSSDAAESIAFNAVQAEILGPVARPPPGQQPQQQPQPPPPLPALGTDLPPPPARRVVKATFEAVYDAGSSVPRAPTPMLQGSEGLSSAIYPAAQSSGGGVGVGGAVPAALIDSGDNVGAVFAYPLPQSRQMR